MKPTTFNWLPVLVLVVLAALSFWIERTAREETVVAGTQKQGIDFWSEHLVVHSFGSDGVLQNVLRADQMVHDSATDISTVITPQLTYVRQPQSVITARSAQVMPDGRKVELIDDVRVVRAASVAGQAPTVVRSERMTVHPDDELAEGTLPVRIEHGRDLITANRFRASNKTGISVLEGQVRATVYQSN